MGPSGELNASLLQVQASDGVFQSIPTNLGHSPKPGAHSPHLSLVAQAAGSQIQSFLPILHLLEESSPRPQYSLP